MRRMLRITAIILLFVMLIPTLALAQGGDFPDVPQENWSVEYVYKAKDLGLMQGRAGGKFGFGDNVSRAEFVTILCNMFKWENDAPQDLPYSDVNKTDWFYGAISTAYNQKILDESQKFYPDSKILRVEMAKLFVRALGLSSAAELCEKDELKFKDVTENKGYISVAHSIGMINGISETEFAPKSYAKREECAAMLVRVYEKYFGKTEFRHNFYAISSFSQKEQIKGSSATTLHWSRMGARDASVSLNTTSEGGNEYHIPQDYESILSYLKDMNQKVHLGIIMLKSDGLTELLSTPENRSMAIDEILKELKRTYSAVGYNPYSGVTIDFEGLKGANERENFNLFLKDLSRALKAEGKSLYVTVSPVLSTGEYFDGYDYRLIGELADKVILMAHDYNPTNLSGFLGTAWHKNCGISPISQVYMGLKAITDEKTGVTDKSKILLGLSFAGVAWKIDGDGRLLSETPSYVSSKTVYEKMQLPNAKFGFSESFRNPYLEYENQDGSRYFLWYENEQSVSEKLALSRLFGVRGVSVWRLGNIPNYEGYDVVESLT